MTTQELDVLRICVRDRSKYRSTADSPTGIEKGANQHKVD
jgi:hypothetical protein